MSGRVRFGGRAFRISNFLGHIHAADTHVARHVGVQEEIYCLDAASPHRLIGNFPTVLLRTKSVTETADVGARTFWQFPLYSPP